MNPEKTLASSGEFNGPIGVDTLKIQVMKSSWYGDESGTTMANGQPYNKWAMTVAHKTLPFGTKLLLTNPTNGHQVVVTVKDRGPFVKGRTLDCSEGVARKLGFWRKGVEYLVAVRLNDVNSEPVRRSHLKLSHSKTNYSNSIGGVVYFRDDVPWSYIAPTTLDNVEDMTFAAKVRAFFQNPRRLFKRQFALGLAIGAFVGRPILEGPNNAVERKPHVLDQPLPH